MEAWYDRFGGSLPPQCVSMDADERKEFRDRLEDETGCVPLYLQEFVDTDRKCSFDARLDAFLRGADITKHVSYFTLSFQV